MGKLRVTIMVLFALILSSVLGMTVAAQQTTDVQPGVSIEGPVTAINGNIVTVGEVQFELDSSDPLLSDANENEVAEAVTFIVTNAPLSAATMTIVGAVESITLNIVTVAGYQIQFNSADPFLAQLKLGDVIKVTGATLNLGGMVVIVPSSVIIIIINPNPGATPTATSTPDPDATPEATPDVDETPEATPDVDETPEVTPEATPDVDGSPIIIIIEGPVTAIIGNIIIIYDIEIQLNPDDPLLTVIQIGDIIRIEGDWVDNGGTIIVIAIIIVIIDVDIYINDGVIWRDKGDCGNGPPPWAPAHGWRRKCENRGRRGGRSS
jgi:hypothetical protein